MFLFGLFNFFGNNNIVQFRLEVVLCVLELREVLIIFIQFFLAKLLQLLNYQKKFLVDFLSFVRANVNEVATFVVFLFGIVD